MFLLQPFDPSAGPLLRGMMRLGVAAQVSVPNLGQICTLCSGDCRFKWSHFACLPVYWSMRNMHIYILRLCACIHIYIYIWIIYVYIHTCTYGVCVYVLSPNSRLEKKDAQRRERRRGRKRERKEGGMEGEIERGAHMKNTPNLYVLTHPLWGLATSCRVPKICPRWRGRVSVTGGLLCV